jgi:hypothetical protein
LLRSVSEVIKGCSHSHIYDCNTCHNWRVAAVE